MISPPIYYDHANAITSYNRPGTVHTKNNALYGFFQRYLLQQAIAAFRWKMPDTWAKNYFLYVLYCWGYIAIINTDKYGVIPQQCGLRGYNVMYQPTNAIISNPLLRGILDPRIGVDCTLIRLQPDYGGVLDLVNYYAEEMALASEAISVNLFNSKLAYIFGASNKSTAESLKALYDQVGSGQPAVFTDKNLLDDQGKPTWIPWAQNIRETYVSTDLLADLRKIECRFLTKIGIPNSNSDKRERMITDEVNSNNVETEILGASWLEELKKRCKEAREMFGIQMDVDWRFKPEEVQNDDQTIDTGSDRL